MNCAPSDAIPEMQALLHARGLLTETFETRAGGPGALAAARGVLSRTALPEGLTIEEIGPATSDASIAALDAMAMLCGALRPAGPVLRGTLAPTVSLMVRAPDGTPVATGLSCRFNRPDGPLGHHAFWGGLLTREDSRGRRLALILGARAMVDLYVRYGFDHFATGVRAGNVASEALCTKLGGLPSRYRTLIAIDPDRFPGQQLTK